MKYLNVYQHIFLSEHNSIHLQPKILIPKYNSTFYIKSSIYSNLSLQLQSTPYCLIPLHQNFNNTSSSVPKNMFDYIKTPLSKRNIVPKRELIERKRQRTKEQQHKVKKSKKVKQIKKQKLKEEEEPLRLTSTGLKKMLAKLLKKIDRKQDKKTLQKRSEELTPAQKQEIASQLKNRMVQLSREQLFDLKDKYFSRGNDKEINFEYFDFSKLKQFENELDIFENLNKSNANHISLQKEELQRKEQKEKEKEKLNDKLDIVPLYEDPFAKQENKNNYNNNISDDDSDSDSDSESISDDI